jgi:hypothetical protein
MAGKSPLPLAKTTGVLVTGKPIRTQLAIHRAPAAGRGFTLGKHSAYCGLGLRG